MSSFIELVNKRESCRNFDLSKKPEKEQLIRCIETARLAPSACNSQPWSFVIVNNPEKSSAVAKCVEGMGMNKFAENCPSFIIICEEKANLTASLGSIVKNQHYAQMDIGIAAAHISYAATDQGLSTCIMGWFNEKKLLKELGLNTDKRIRLVLAVGYAKESQLRNKKRKTLDEIMTYIG